MYNKQDSHMITWDIKEHSDKSFTRMVWAGYPDIPKYHNVLFPVILLSCPTNYNCFHICVTGHPLRL